MIAEVPKMIQGLYDPKGASGAYWLLLAKIELLGCSRREVETPDKDNNKVYPNPKKRRT